MPRSSYQASDGSGIASLLSQALEHAVEYSASLPGRPVPALATAEDLRALLGGPLPSGPEDPDAIVDRLTRAGEVGTVASAGPRYFGFVMGGALPAAVAADWLVSAWDQNASLYATSPTVAVIEEVCAAWVLELTGLPSTASVGFVTGGQMAHFTCLAAARHRLLAGSGWDVVRHGLHGAPALTVIATEERHASIEQALHYLGVGTDAVRTVACDGNGAIKPDNLARVLADSEGLRIVCAQAGSINTGAIDPLDAVCDLAHAHGAWVHIDGAIGLWAAASPRFAEAMRGLTKADSWAADGHKLLNTPYDCGVAICAHPDSHRSATGTSASYLVASAHRDDMDWTPEWSRRARAVPLYAVLRALGRSGVAELVDRSCEHARRFANGLGSLAGVEILNDVVLNQVLVRFHGFDHVDPNTLTDQVIDLVQKDGTCWLGGTTWRGMRAMRISVCNWMTTSADVDQSIAAIGRAYHEALAKEGRETVS